MIGLLVLKGRKKKIGASLKDEINRTCRGQGLKGGGKRNRWTCKKAEL